MTSTPVDPAAASGPVDRVAECEALRAEVERLRENVKGLAEVLGKLTEAHKRKCYATLDAETERDEARAQLAAAEARLEAIQADVKRYAEALLSMRCSKYRDVGGWAWLNAEGIGAKLAALASPPEPEADECNHDCPKCWAERHEGHDVGWHHEDGSLLSATCHDCNETYHRAEEER